MFAGEVPLWQLPISGLVPRDWAAPVHDVVVDVSRFASKRPVRAVAEDERWVGRCTTWGDERAKCGGGEGGRRWCPAQVGGTVSGIYVSFDVDGIAAYVFAAVSPSEVMGASRLIEDFCQRAEKFAHQRGGKAVFVGGGSGVVELDEDAVPAFTEALRDDLAARTKGAATCTLVAVPATGDFGDCWAALTAEMSRAKRERGLRRSLATLVDADTPPDQVCGSCGREPGDAGVRHDRPVGPQCLARANAADDVVVLADRRVRVTCNLEEMMSKSDGEGRDLLATIYLDADNLGVRLQAVRDATELGSFAASLRRGVQVAVSMTVGSCGLDGQVVLPVVGGDDVVLICDAGRTLEVLAALWEHLDVALEGVGGAEPLRFSAGVAIGPVRAPLRVHFDLARRALKAAKARSKRAAGKASAAGAGEPYVEVRSFAPLAGHSGDEPLFGEPVPRSALDGFVALVGQIRSLPRAQVAGLRHDLDEAVPVVRTLHLDYRAARHAGVASVCASAEAVAGTTGLPMESVLRGILDLEPVVR
jgi:hypothetical protein